MLLEESPEIKKKRTKSIFEYNLLKKNCEDKYRLLSGEGLIGYSTWFYPYIIRINIALTERETDINREIAIENMKNYLGVWKRDI